MADNTDEEHLEIPKEIQSESPADEIIPTADTETINLNQETENMEVHHHAHHEGKKNWKSYLWEFLMLFLAVFCGFLAEYQLEHKIEKDRAKELAKSFYEELRNDSVTVAEKFQYRLGMESSLQYLRNYFKDSSVTNHSKKFVVNYYYGMILRSPSIFEPRAAVLEQLKNSGSLRYFKNDEFQKLVGEISVDIHNINSRQNIETSYREANINPFILKHFDSDFEDEITKQFGKKNLTGNLPEWEKSDSKITFELSKVKEIDIVEVRNMLSFFTLHCRGTRTIQFQNYIETNAKLLQVLREKYNIN